MFSVFMVEPIRQNSDYDFFVVVFAISVDH